MNHNYEQVGNLLTNFLKEISDKDPYLHNKKKLITFAFRREEFVHPLKVDSILRSESPSFYLSRDSSKFKLLAIGKAIEVSTNREEQFDEIKEKISQIGENFISNLEEIKLKHVPLFVGGKKFSLQQDSGTWEDFPESYWFVPRLMILQYNDITAGLFTFQSDAANLQPEEIVSSLLLELNRIDSAPQSTLKRGTINSIEGNSSTDKQHWVHMVEKALEAIENQKVKKVVVSRKVELRVSPELDFATLIRQLENDYPDCYTFVFHSRESFFFGATPERLARFSNEQVYTDALAGSAPRGKTKEEDIAIGQKLLSDPKNLAEQKFVLDHIVNSLMDYVDEISIQEEPELMKLANIQHLHSKIVATLKHSSSMLSIVEQLHPTPAVCGHPRDSALELIRRLEGYPRGMYSGIIGWFNFNGDGEFAVAIRSALAKKNRVIAFAGCGIVKGSQPESEFNETNLKLKPILSLFEHENKN